MFSLQPEMTYRVMTTKPLDRWLERSLFVAAGRLEGTGMIEYAVHRVT